MKIKKKVGQVALALPVVHIFRLGKPFLGCVDLRTDNDVEIVNDNYLGTFSIHISISERV